MGISLATPVGSALTGGAAGPAESVPIDPTADRACRPRFSVFQTGPRSAATRYSPKLQFGAVDLSARDWILRHERLCAPVAGRFV